MLNPRLFAEIRKQGKQGKQSRATFSVVFKAYQVKAISTASQRQFHQYTFKEQLITEYQCGSSNRDFLKCMVTGYFIQRGNVIASHLISLASESTLRILNYHPSFKWNPKNGLLLYKSIDKAYENMEITFLLHSQTSIITIQVLYDDLLLQKVFDGLPEFTFFEGYGARSKPRRKNFGKL